MELIMMKKFTLSLLMLGLAIAVSAQNQPYKEIKASQGEVYAKQQESYTPSFKNDGSNAKGYKNRCANKCYN